MSQRICAIVVTYNRKELLRQCLVGLREQTRSADCILVVDNHSTDGTLEMVRHEFPAVEVLALPDNQGGAGGFHEGMKWAYAQGFDWLWVMDDDGCPHPDCLRLLAAHIDARPNWVLGALCVLPDDPGHLSFTMPSSSYEFGDRTEWVAELKGATDKHGVIEGWACFMNAVMFPRSVVDAVGLPIKKLFIWGDEVEYYKRILAAGRKVGTVPGALHSHPPDKVPWQTAIMPKWVVYPGVLDWKAFCFFRNLGYISRYYGRGRGISILLRYFYFYLVRRKLDWKSAAFFIRAYIAGWQDDFSRKVPY